MAMEHKYVRKDYNPSYKKNWVSHTIGKKMY